jgi:CheY-like chemotaxis protein
VSLKVLLADDSMTAQNMGRKILAESGYDVTTVSNGAAAVKKIAEVKPDLVILDIYMPGYTGLEVCERVRANFDTANLPVLLTVGKMEPYRAEDGAKVRADGVIVKPFEATDLLAVVKKMTEKLSAVPVRHVVEEEPEQEESFQDVGTPAQSVPLQVDVPSEIAVAPAMAMEEFTAGSDEPFPSSNRTMEWSAPTEVARAATASFQSAPIAEIPWSFDQSPVFEQPVMENLGEVAHAPGIEFTSAPQVGEIEVQAAEGLTLDTAQISHDPVVESTEPELASAQEITQFVTSFDTTGVEKAEEPAPSMEAPAEISWGGWSQMDTAATVEPATLEKPQGVIDDFEAKVAAAMSGFETEPVEAPLSSNATESHADVVAIPAPSEDFEARVAAAMSDFSGTDSATEEVVASVPEATHEVLSEAAPVESPDDFEARLTAAMASFDQTSVENPSVESPAVAATEETQELTPVQESKPSINLNETMVLPQEAMLSLEEEMNRSLNEHVAEIPKRAEIEWETPPAVEEPASFSQSEAFSSPAPVQEEPELMGEFDPAHVVPEAAEHHDAQPVVAQEAAPAESAAPAPEVTGSEKFAAAVQRAIERLKPQLIAEIVKELKGE